MQIELNETEVSYLIMCLNQRIADLYKSQGDPEIQMPFETTLVIKLHNFRDQLLGGMTQVEDH